MSEADLDSCFPHGYAGTLPAGAGSELRAAAIAYSAGLQPATSAERQAVLIGLRSATVPRRELNEEADASFALLRVHLEDVPLDILKDACRAYCNLSGTTFFPRSAGELRTLTNPMMAERKSRAFRLRWLADQADQADAERERLENDPLTADAVAAIKREFGLGQGDAPSVPPAPAATRPAGPAVATVDDYLKLGLSQADAEQAVADHARMLARSRPKPVTDATDAVLDAATRAAA